MKFHPEEAFSVVTSRIRFHRRTPPGSAPGTLVSVPDAPPPVIRVTGFDSEALEEDVVASAAEALAWRERHSTIWISVEGVGDADTVRELGEGLGLHRLALEDVVHVHQRAKLEPYADHIYVVCQMPEAGGQIETQQLSLFVGPDFVVSFQERPTASFEPIRDRLRAGRGRIRSSGPDYLAYALLDAVVDHYFPVLESLGERLETLEERVVLQPDREVMRGIHEVKRDLLLLRRAVWPLRDALGALYRDPLEVVSAETRPFLRDCHDHAFQILDLLETYREVASGLMDVYLSSLGNRTNEIMKVLTMFAAIFIPLTFIAGVYGMNFDPAESAWNMPEIGWRFGYPFALAVMALVAGGMLLYFRRKGWLGGR